MPDSEHGDAVADLFASAVELPSEKRKEFVDSAPANDAVCREVASLLEVYERAQAQPDRLDAGLAAAVLGGEDPTIKPASGRRIGPYRVLRELGRGGMGVVYLAERADGAYEQQVAIKLLPAALGSAALADRFLLERQILAGLEHSGIARLLDGGVAEHGEPYLVLEYVDGEPLTEWCDARRLGIRERLEVFLRVCEAVQYAHGHLVVHRDLKPSNILVTEGGEVKLLDFGIAKLLAEGGDADATVLTQLGLRPYTPGYAAPEQQRGEAVTVATDVYGLGVLLYELLCGRRPRDDDTAGRRRNDDWVEPTRPSVKATRAKEDREDAPGADAAEIATRRDSRPDRLRRHLEGDLDTITLKALREEPSERYESVQALAEDVRRHLEGLPIAARPASASYRSGKFLRRHWVGATATGLVVLAVLAGLAGTIWQARVAERERDAARAEAAKAEQVAGFLADVFRRADPLESRGEEMTVREALDRGAERIEEELADQPIVQADLMGVLGGTYLELGDLERAEGLIARELELRREHQEDDHPDLADAVGRLGALRFHQGDYDGALELTRQAVEIIEKALGPRAEELIKSLNNIGILSVFTGDHGPGLAAHERALEIAESHQGPDSRDVGEISNNLGTLLMEMGDDERALETLERALAIQERELGPRAPSVANSLNNISIIRIRSGEYEGVEESLQRVLAIYRMAYGEVHHRVGSALNQLGDLYAATGREQEAVEAYQQAAQTHRQHLGESHPWVAYPLRGLGELYLNDGRPGEALPYLQEAVALQEASVEPSKPFLARCLSGLGTALAALGRLNEAEVQLRRSLAGWRAADDTDDSQIASAAVDLAAVLIDQARCDEAKPLLTEASAILATTDDADSETAGEIGALLVRCLA